MSIRTIAFNEDEYYHIYNRGNSKQIIYKDVQDYERFVALLYACNSMAKLRIWNISLGQSVFDLEHSDHLVAIGAYVLMPNHFHILLTPLVDGGVSKFMQKISTAYSMYFNKKYERTGSLFEGKFKSQHAYDDRYLKYLFSYIHLNPIKLVDPKWKIDGIKNKKETLDYLQKFKHSSYQDFLGIPRKENKVLDLPVFPKYFPTKKAFENEILNWFTPSQE